MYTHSIETVLCIRSEYYPTIRIECDGSIHLEHTDENNTVTLMRAFTIKQLKLIRKTLKQAIRHRKSLR